LAWPLAAAAQPAVVFKHVVIVVQENRTPDNLFGSAPHFEKGVDIGTSGVDSQGQTIKLTREPLQDCYDISHDHSDFEAMLTQGADQEALSDKLGCVIPANPQFKFVDNSSGVVQPYFDIATGYGFANRMFQTNQGPSFPAHQFLFGGTSAPSVDSPLFVAENMNVMHEGAGCVAEPSQTVNLIDGFGSETSNAPIFPCLDHNTLADLLDGAGVSWRYYSSSVNGIWTAPNAIRHICDPVPSGDASKCVGPAWTRGNVVPTNPAQVLSDTQACDLPAVSWVIPTAADSDHAESNQGMGPAWVASIVNTIGQQPACADGEVYWNDTAILITWDDWGGWYDHVPPVAVNLQPGSPPGWGAGYTYGFRVPLLVVSAYTPQRTVDNTVHDFGSILYFVEQNFGLGFIGDGSLYGQYADYQAALRGDTLGAFFPHKTPEVFRPIAASPGAAYFIRQPASDAPIDSD
jgi:phospholipase C